MHKIGYLVLIKKIDSLLLELLKEARTTKFEDKRLFANKLRHILRFYFLSLFGYNRWNKIGAKVGFRDDERPYLMTVNEKDITSYIPMITKLLLSNSFSLIEAYYRKYSNKQNISEVLKTIYGSDIPPSLNILRLIRNSFHQDGIHSTPDKNVWFGGRMYKFRKGKEVMYMHPIWILNLISDAATQVMDHR